MAKHIANILTGCRILGSILLLFFPAFSLVFYIVYLLCGFSDMIDGTVARKTNSTSHFGSQLDTIADLVFVVAAMIKPVAGDPSSGVVVVLARCDCGYQDQQYHMGDLFLKNGL